MKEPNSYRNISTTNYSSGLFSPNQNSVNEGWTFRTNISNNYKYLNNPLPNIDNLFNSPHNITYQHEFLPLPRSPSKTSKTNKTPNLDMMKKKILLAQDNKEDNCISPHIKQRLNSMLWKTLSKSTIEDNPLTLWYQELIEPKNNREITKNMNNNNNSSSQNSLWKEQTDTTIAPNKTLEKTVEIIRTITPHLKKKRRNQIESDREMLFKTKMKEYKEKICRKNNFINSTNTHANWFSVSDPLTITKSASYQRIQHMKQRLNLDLYGTNDPSDIQRNWNNDNLFIGTQERRIKNCFHDLKKFEIFPDYNMRKENKELKELYAKNNLNIMSGIKETFAANKEEMTKEGLIEGNNNNAFKPDLMSQFEDIDVDDWLS